MVTLVIGTCGAVPFKIIGHLNKFTRNHKISTISANGTGALIALLLAVDYELSDISALILNNNDLLLIMHGIYPRDPIMSHRRIKKYLSDHIHKFLGGDYTIYDIYQRNSVKVYTSHYLHSAASVVSIDYTSGENIVDVIMKCINIELSYEYYNVGGYGIDGGFYDTTPIYPVCDMENIFCICVNRKCRSTSLIVRSMFLFSRFRISEHNSNVKYLLFDDDDDEITEELISADMISKHISQGISQIFP